MSGSSVTGIGPGSVQKCKCREISIYLKALSDFVSIRFQADLTGSINGVNRVFTMIVPGNELLLFKNGILQSWGVDYTIDSTLMTITFNIGNIPQIGDVLTARVSKNLIEWMGLPDFDL